MVSSELVLVSEERVYSFLGGTLPEAFASRPNDLLKHEVALWARSRGKRQFVLGGGYQPDDGIYRYKLAFAPGGEADFCTYRHVCLPETYDALVQARAAKAEAEGESWAPPESFFPAYRG